MTCITDIHQADAKHIGILIDCCIQSYNAYSCDNVSQCHSDRVVPPQGYELIDSWSGIDAIFNHDKTVESYGLVFRSLEAPWHYIFSFRGTDSLLDMLDDCGVEPQPFVPFDSTIGVPSNVHVESGFNDIYSCTGDTLPSMQAQLFTLVDKYQASDKPISKADITGHSLGAALSQLFTLDMSLCRSSIQINNINFASPRVGNKAFVGFYQTHSPETTLRVQNTHDAVPHVPPTEFGFEHIPSVYLVSFYRECLLGKLDLMANHSSLNYQAVVTCAGMQSDGVCINKQLNDCESHGPICSERPNVKKQRPLMIEMTGIKQATSTAT